MTFQQWLKNIVSEVESNIRESRVYESYFHNVDYDADPDSFNFFRSERGDEFFKYSGKEYIKVASLKKIDLNPEKINLRFGKDWNTRFSDKSTFVDVSDVWRTAIGEENKIIINTLMKVLEKVEIKKSDYKGIDEAIERIIYFSYPDIYLLLNPIQISNLLKNNNFKHKSQLNPTFVEEKGKAFEGFLGSLSVYWNFGLSPNEGIIYEKKASNLKITSLDVGFDSDTDPEILHVNEMLYAWFDDTHSAVKVRIV